MKRPKHILAVVDPTAMIHPAVDKAATLAIEFGGRLELFICEPDLLDRSQAPATGVAPEPSPNLLNARREMLEVLAHPLRRSGLEVITDVAWTNPLYEGLLNKIIAAHADLVVKDTHPHPLVGRALLTNTDWHLIRSCPAPLLLTKPTDWPTCPHIVTAVDPGHQGDKPAALDCDILDWGATLAEELHGELHAVHAYVPIHSTNISRSSPLLAPEAYEQERSQQMEQLNSLMWGCNIPRERLHLLQGAASETLPAEAIRLEASIVIMGAVSRSAIKRIFIGNTAEKVLDRLPCDVLIVKPFTFACDMPF